MFMSDTNRVNSIRKMNLFYLFYIIYLIESVLSESRYVEISVINLILIVLRYLSLVGFVCLAVNKQKHIGQSRFIIILVVLTSAAMTIFLFEGGISLLFIIFIALASKNTSLEKLFEITILCISISYAFVIVSSKFGIVSDVTAVRWIGINSVLRGEYVRHTMGFLVSNQVPVTFIMLYLLIIALKKDKISIRFNIGVICLNFYFFFIFGSRVAFLIMFVTLIVYYLINISYKVAKVKIMKIDRILSYNMVFLAILSFFISYLYTPSRNFELLDEFFNHRISMSSQALAYYGIGLLGRGKLAGTYYGELSSVTVDNGYISFVIQNGIVAGVVLLVLWTYMLKYSMKFNNRYVVLGIIVIGILNFINSDLISYRVAVWYCILFNQNDRFLTENQSAVGRSNIRRIQFKRHK